MAEIISFSNLHISIEKSPHEARYTFVGEVDENFRQEQVPRVDERVTRFVLKDINQFNSVGIREWIHFILDMKNRRKLIFQDCSVALVDLINMVPDALGNGQVESFYAPYYCNCGKELNKLIITKKYHEQLKQLIAPTFTCDCGRTLQFDALEESYFQFIA